MSRKSKTADLSQSLQNAVAGLAADQEDVAAVAAASLAMLAQQGSEQDPILHAAVQRLVPILLSGAALLQRNACTALISIVQLGPQCWDLALREHAMPAAINLMNSTNGDVALRLNATVLAGALVEGGETGPPAFLQAEGMAALQSMLSRETDAQLLEAAVDDVCKLAAEPSSRPQLVYAGMIPRLAGLLGIRDQPETLVRALMGIAMLLGDSPGRLQQLAAAPGAVKSMAAIMRGSDDQDSKAIATSIFAALANDGEAKKAVATALQQL